MNREIIIVLGKTGTGKSLWCKLFTRGNKRLLVFDPMSSPEFENVEWLNHEGIFNLFDEENEGVIQQKKFRFGAFEFEAVDTFGNTAFVTGNNLLLLEESSQIFKKGCALPDWANKLVFMGRHESCSLLVTAQRASSIPIDLRSQASRIVTFRQSEKNDLKWFDEFFDKDLIEQISILPNGICLDWTNQETDLVDIRPQVKKVFAIDIL